MLDFFRVQQARPRLINHLFKGIHLRNHRVCVLLLFYRSVQIHIECFRHGVQLLYVDVSRLCCFHEPWQRCCT